MKSWIVLSVLGRLCAFVQTQCNVEGGDYRVPFPNIENKAYLSYQMSMEYTVPDAGQTDYYTEYYDILNRRGRVEARQAGKSVTYIYNALTYEAWDIAGWSCTFKYLNDTPEMFRDGQNDWLYVPDKKETIKSRTIGPSAMLKIAYDKWYNTVNTTTPKVFYMGEYETKVRGIKGVYWRRCDVDQSYVDYIFTGENYENPYGLKNFKTLPIRILFNGKGWRMASSLSKQRYDIVQFQPFISEELRPFDLPSGKGCRRRVFSKDDDIPKQSDFSRENLQFNAEVIYQTVDVNGHPNELVTYYNTLSMALDVDSQLLAYHYSPWNKTAPKSKPSVLPPLYTVFDMKYGYLYRYNLSDGQCQFIRQKRFTPIFELPQGRGGISLTDPQVLFPNDESVFLSEGVNKGLRVNVFEQISSNYMLYNGDDFIPIPKSIITHSYLQDYAVVRGINSVRNALSQVQMRFFGRLKNRAMELVTINFYDFSTKIRNRQNTFDVKKCYKNNFVWVTLTFNADESILNKIKHDVPSIQANVLNAIMQGTELTAARFPVLLVDFNRALYVTMQILGRPPVLDEFSQPELGRKITGTEEQEGISDEDTCATKCLDSAGCWGFSMCGAVCTFGRDFSAKVEETKEYCKFYKRDSGTIMPSTDLVIQNLRQRIDTGVLKLVLRDKNNRRIQLQAGSIEVINPREADLRFERLGNVLNPRMNVVKLGYKLKSSAGSTVKNMGRLKYEECQEICLDYRDCETVSYCLDDSECILSKTYGGDMASTYMETNNMCNVITRKYADNFNRSPGIVRKKPDSKESLFKSTVEECARACLNRTGYRCLSFDQCLIDGSEVCHLYSEHHPNPKTREEISEPSWRSYPPSCRHYAKKFSTEFKKSADMRIVGSRLPIWTNRTLEDCARACIEHGKGTCVGYDFCQERRISATSCTLLDSDTDTVQFVPIDIVSPICTNYFRSDIVAGPERPYSDSYAVAMGILLLLIGCMLGYLIVFEIHNLRVNKSWLKSKVKRAVNFF